MSSDGTWLNSIEVSAAARSALVELTDAHGGLMFHISSGFGHPRSPICLPRGELRLGPDDRLIGYADDIPVYETLDLPARFAVAYRLDVVPGVPIGFSLPAGPRHRFTLREITR